MAAFNLITTLMVLQGLLFSYSMADDEMPGSGSSEDISPTPSQMMSTPSSSVVTETRSQGPNVTLTLAVSINCSGDNLMRLSGNLEDNIKQVYETEAFPIHTVDVMEACDEESELFDAIITLSFFSDFPQGKTIKGVFEDALKNGKITDLTPDNTNFTITFVGVSFTYVPKDGQCEAICCDGAGGELTVERVCTPEDKCKGIESQEKQEKGHCPGEEKATCSNTCVVKEEESGSRNNLPTFPVIILLVLTKTILC